MRPFPPSASLTEDYEWYNINVQLFDTTCTLLTFTNCKNPFALTADIPTQREHYCFWFHVNKETNTNNNRSCRRVLCYNHADQQQLHQSHK